MRTIYRTTLIAVAIVFLLPLSARSEIKAGSFEVSPFGGYNFFESRQNLEDRPVFGARLGYNFTENFGIEAVGEYIRTGVDDKAETWRKEGQFTSPIDDVDITSYHLDLLYHFMPEKKFNPFIAAGYGFANYSPEINSRDMAIINFGLGAKYWLTDNIAFRFNLRDNMVYDETIHNVEATVGIVFAFGGTKKPAPAAVARYEPKPEPKAEKPIVVLASEPKAEEKVVVLASEPTERVVVLAFEDIHFNFDKATLKPEAQTILKRNIRLLKENPKAKISIAGYTSASGTEAYNQKLSERRANAVQKYLINEGIITRDRLSTIGYGETNPLIYEAAPKEIYSAAAKANMRVLFEIVVK